jgi:hypothetical protein
MDKGFIEPFLTTASGGKFYPLGPNGDDARIEDIAHSLACLARYNGHTSYGGEPVVYSVATHSLEVSRLVEIESMGRGVGRDTAAQVAYCGLMHDAAEFCLTDIPRPIKPLVANYKQWEATVEFVLSKPGSEAWKRYGVEESDLYDPILPLTPGEGKRLFLEKFHELRERIGL